MAITLEQLNCSINHQVILSDISVAFHEGIITSVIGPSGSGKTTLLRCLAGIQKYHGTITSKQPLTFGYVEQHYNLFPHLSVFNNIAYPLRVRHQSKSVITSKVNSISEHFQINSLCNKQPHQLSGGEQQRVALARALVYEPNVLLLDEPFAALDALLRYDLLHWLKAEIAQRQLTAILVTHDITEAQFMSTQVVVLDSGICVAAADWHTLQSQQNPTVQSLLQKRLP